MIIEINMNLIDEINLYCTIDLKARWLFVLKENQSMLKNWTIFCIP